MQVIADQPFSAMLSAPGGTTGLGARVEVPVTREIVSAWVAAVPSGAMWVVTLPAPPAPGDYLLVWRTDDPEPPDYEAFVPLSVGPLLVDITPTPADVSGLLYDMLVQEGGQPVTAFDDTTTPTGTQVEGFIAAALDEVLGRVQVPVPDRPTTVRLARWVVTVQAARLVVAFFNSERSDDAASSTKLDQMFNAAWPDLVAACRTPYATRLA